MDEGLLVSERISAGEDFLKQIESLYPVESAFWLKKPDGEWHLYVASTALKNVTSEAYADVIRIVRAMDNLHLHPNQVKLRRVTDSPVKHALSLNRWKQGHVFSTDVFGNLPVEAAYVYPPTHANAVA